MSRSSSAGPKTRALAQQLLAYEVGAAGGPSEANTPAVFCVVEKLRQPLSTLAGSSGFRSLLMRALTLAKAQAPELSTVQVKPDGSLDGWGSEALEAQAGVILIAQLLELLVTFIGERLVMNLVLDSWPNLSSINGLEKKNHDPPK
jgi:hypothetical protein